VKISSPLRPHALIFLGADVLRRRDNYFPGESSSRVEVLCATRFLQVTNVRGEQMVLLLMGSESGSINKRGVRI
jgi:hypothetical protein